MLTNEQIETIRQNAEDAICSYTDKTIYFKRSYDVLAKDVPALLEQIVLLQDETKRLERKIVELADDWIRLLKERNKYKGKLEFYKNYALTSVIESLDSKDGVADQSINGISETTTQSIAAEEVISPQNKRSYFVDEAKKDVEFWLSTSVENVPMIKGGYASYIPNSDKVEFIVNRKNREVTALIKDADGHVFAKGIAKCSPEDRFNAHIGRAIALRRALGVGVQLYKYIAENYQCNH